MPDGRGYAARSDIGLMRTGNEDGFLARPPVFAVADGMGGHQAGEVASGLAIDLLADAAERTPTPSLDEVVTTIETSNAAIRREARSRADLSGMGTTCTVIVVDAAIHVAHVGDSRAYRLRDDELVQLTDDHSLVATLVREGIMAPADALTDGRRNIITRALGGRGPGSGRCRHGRPSRRRPPAGLLGRPPRSGRRCGDRRRPPRGDRPGPRCRPPGRPCQRRGRRRQRDGHRHRPRRHRRGRREGTWPTWPTWRDVADVADAGDVGDVDPATDARPRRRRAIRRAALILVLVLAVAAIAFVIAAWLWVRSATPA